MEELPVRHLSGPVWHQTRTERGAWAELFRHWGQDEISPFEIHRRVGRARVADLKVLDLTDAEVCERLGVTEDELVADGLERCQLFAEQARDAGLDGVLASSGALAGERTLVVFSHAMSKVVVEHSRVQRPPIRMLDVLLEIRIPRVVAGPVGQLYQAIAATARRLGRRPTR